MRFNQRIYAEDFHLLRNCQAQINGKWRIARPRPLYSIIAHLRNTWLVFTGRADALIWHED